MAKYHINEKGNPGRCRAKAGQCPFGDADFHYSSKAEAREAYEARMASQFRRQEVDRKLAEFSPEDTQVIEDLIGKTLREKTEAYPRRQLEMIAGLGGSHAYARVAEYLTRRRQAVSLIQDSIPKKDYGEMDEGEKKLTDYCFWSQARDELRGKEESKSSIKQGGFYKAPEWAKFS